MSTLTLVLHCSQIILITSVV